MPYPSLLARSFALTVIASALFSTSAQSQEIPEKSTNSSHWGFNLTSYLWLSGTDINATIGSKNKSARGSFIDIADKSRRFPLGFSGRFEAHYDKFAFYLDGNYMNIKLRPKFDRLGEGINSETGIMDYGLMYRVLGANASEIQNYQGKQRPAMLDVYAGARTIWMGSSLTVSGPLGVVNRTSKTNTSFTSPVIGARAAYDLTPNWFVLADANIGGFGAQTVQLTSNLLGAVGYRTSIFNVPTSIEAGYKALYYNVDKNGASAAQVWLNGPFLGVTGHW